MLPHSRTSRGPVRGADRLPRARRRDPRRAAADHPDFVPILRLGAEQLGVGERGRPGRLLRGSVRRGDLPGLPAALGPDASPRPCATASCAAHRAACTGTNPTRSRRSRSTSGSPSRTASSTTACSWPTLGRWPIRRGRRARRTRACRRWCSTSDLDSNTSPEGAAKWSHDSSAGRSWRASTTPTSARSATSAAARRTS